MPFANSVLKVETGRVFLIRDAKRKHSVIAPRDKTIATSIDTELIPADDAGIARAAQLLAAGQLVAFGTETVYGLGADARNGQAVAQIYATKGRPGFNPLIVHVHDLDAARALIDLPESLDPLTDLWPGPLTLVARMRDDAGIAGLVTAGLATLAVRIPANPGAQALLRAFGGPVAAPSANTSGQISPSRAGHVMADLGGRIAAILDTGPCDVGLESTIVGDGLNGPTLLRPGGIPAAVLETRLGEPLAPPPAGAITAPGQLASHYAPGAQLRINISTPPDPDCHIAFGPGPGRWNLSETSDLTEAAARLFDLLHKADAAACGTITVAPIPRHGLGQAINDRLTRAAAPRPVT